MRLVLTFIFVSLLSRFDASDLTKNKFHQILNIFIMYLESFKITSNHIEFSIIHILGFQVNETLHALLSELGSSEKAVIEKATLAIRVFCTFVEEQSFEIKGKMMIQQRYSW